MTNENLAIIFGLVSALLCISLIFKRSEIKALESEIKKSEKKVEELEEELRTKQLNHENHEKVQAYKEVLSDLSGDNKQLKNNLHSASEHITVIEAEKEYLTEASERFRHDCQGRFELIKQVLKSEDRDEDDVVIANRQIKFLSEALSLFLAKDMAGYVQITTNEGRDRFSLNKRASELIDAFKSRDEFDRLVIHSQDDIDVFGDWIHFEIVLENLIKNAFEHSVGGEEVGVWIRRDEDQATVEVYNDSPHINEDDQAKIFDKGLSSKEADALGRKKGFGLYIVNQIVTGFGGKVEIKNSTKEKRGARVDGVRFIVTVPCIEMVAEED